MVELGFNEFVAVVEKWWDSGKGADGKAEECESFETLGEVVNLVEDDGKRLEP